MSGLDGLGAGLPLGRPAAQVMIRSIRLIEPASLRFVDGGCSRPRAAFHAELIDVSSGRMYLVPFDHRFARLLHTQLGALLDSDKTTETEKQ